MIGVTPADAVAWRQRVPVSELNLIETDRTFERTKENARINELAYINRDQPDFSVKIRQNYSAVARKDP